MIGSVLASTALVLWGRYKGVERVATAIAAVLGIASVAAAVTVSPALGPIGAGLVPRLPAEVDYAEIPRLGGMVYSARCWIGSCGAGVLSYAIS